MSPRPRYRRPAPSTLEKAVIASVAHAEWLTPTDEGAVWFLRDQALILDTQLRREMSLDGSLAVSGEYVEIATLTWRALSGLGLTPVARHRLGLWEETVDDAFAEVIRLAETAAGNGED